MNKRILGIDPGSRIAGFGVLEYSCDGEVSYLAHGVIDVKSKSEDFYRRLYELGLGFRQILEQYRPQAVALENIFLGKNADSAFKLGHARGVIAYEVVQKNLPVFEYSTRAVKKTVTGTGSADKEQVRSVLQMLLKFQNISQLDASDALAVAYHHVAQEIIESRLRRMTPKRELTR